MLRQEDIQYQQQKHQDNQSQEHQQGEKEAENRIFSTTNIWLAGPKQKPTFQLPLSLAKKYHMDKPCRIAFIDNENNGGGILMKFLHYNKKDE